MGGLIRFPRRSETQWREPAEETLRATAVPSESSLVSWLDAKRRHDGDDDEGGGGSAA